MKGRKEKRERGRRRKETKGKEGKKKGGVFSLGNSVKGFGSVPNFFYLFFLSFWLSMLENNVNFQPPFSKMIHFVK